MRTRFRNMVVALLVAGFVGVLVSRTWSPPVERPFQSFDEVVAEHSRGGWRLVEKPNLPGPYRDRGSFQTNVGSGGGTDSRNDVSQVSHRFTPKPGISQMAVTLETEDGRLTLALFEK